MSRSVIIVILLFSISIPAWSQQYRYAEKFLIHDEDKWVQESLVDPLGAVLISGYLKGKIKAYKFSNSDSVLIWGPKRSDVKPWKAGEYYFADDVVEYKDKAYRPIMDTDKSPENNSEWQMEGLYIPASFQRYFPSLRDTLSITDFFIRMTKEKPIFPDWDPNIVYLNEDFVVKNGIPYKSLSDNKGKNPSTNPADWEEDNQGGIRFNEFRDLNRTSILFHYEVAGSDTTWHPLMITVYKQGIDVIEPVAHFYYQDVVSYLNSIALPVLDRTGDPGKHFVLAWDERSRASYGQWLKTKIKARVLNPREKDILHPKLYNDWLSDTTQSMEYLLQGNWQLMQQQGTKALVLSKGDPDSWNRFRSTPFLVLPIKTIKQLYKRDRIEAQTFTTYRDLLKKHEYWKAYPETHRIDSLKPFHSADANINYKAERYYLLENYHARLDSGNNQVVTTMIRKWWPILMENFNSGKISDHFEPYSYFPDTYPWSRSNPWKVGSNEIRLDPSFSFSDMLMGIDSVYEALEWNDIEVVYRKEWNVKEPATEVQPQPVYIIFYYKHTLENYIPNRVSLDWKEFKNLLNVSNAPDREAFIQLIESGSLTFDNSHLNYGLMEGYPR